MHLHQTVDEQVLPRRERTAAWPLFVPRGSTTPRIQRSGAVLHIRLFEIRFFDIRLFDIRFFQMRFLFIFGFPHFRFFILVGHGAFGVIGNSVLDYGCARTSSMGLESLFFCFGGGTSA
jgi:hypothetical protein